MKIRAPSLYLLYDSARLHREKTVRFLNDSSISQIAKSILREVKQNLWRHLAGIGSQMLDLIFHRTTAKQNMMVPHLPVQSQRHFILTTQILQIITSVILLQLNDSVKRLKKRSTVH